MHLAGRSYARVPGESARPALVAQRRAGGAAVPRRASDAQLLDAELAFQARHRFPDLPRGPVHADLFRDNALFEDGRICGVVDFYFAGVDCLLYDVAVCANDWCLSTRPMRLDERRAPAPCSPPITRCGRSARPSATPGR